MNSLLCTCLMRSRLCLRLAAFNFLYNFWWQDGMLRSQQSSHVNCRPISKENRTSLEILEENVLLKS